VALGSEGEDQISQMNKLVRKLGICADRRGHDLVEYALLAGFVAVAAGAIMPGVANEISEILRKIPTMLQPSNHGSMR